MNDEYFKGVMKSLKQEVTNLKIAHDRGLGIIKYYSAHEYWIMDDQPWYIRAKIKPGQPIPFMVQLYFSEPIWGTIRADKPVEIDEQNGTITWHLWQQFIFTEYVEIVAISTSQLADLEIGTEAP